jgi:L-amino acid N-acyltransferase YncA
MAAEEKLPQGAQYGDIEGAPATTEEQKLPEGASYGEIAPGAGSTVNNFVTRAQAIPGQVKEALLPSGQVESEARQKIVSPTAHALGIPTTGQEVEEQRKEQEERESHPIKTAIMAYPPVQAGRMLYDAAGNLIRGQREGAKEASEALANIKAGQPVLSNLGKMGYGYLHGVLQGIPFVGGNVERMGEAIHKGDIAAATGEGIAAAGQVATLGTGESPETTARLKNLVTGEEASPRLPLSAKRQAESLKRVYTPAAVPARVSGEALNTIPVAKPTIPDQEITPAVAAQSAAEQGIKPVTRHAPIENSRMNLIATGKPTEVAASAPEPIPEVTAAESMVKAEEPGKIIDQAKAAEPIEKLEDKIKGRAEEMKEKYPVKPVGLFKEPFEQPPVAEAKAPVEEPKAKAEEPKLEEPKLVEDAQRGLEHRIGAEAAADKSPEGIDRAQRLVKGTNADYATWANKNGPEKPGGGDWEAKDFSKAGMGTKEVHPLKKFIIDHAVKNVPHKEFMADTEGWGPKAEKEPTPIEAMGAPSGGSQGVTEEKPKLEYKYNPNAAETNQAHVVTTRDAEGKKLGVLSAQETAPKEVTTRSNQVYDKADRGKGYGKAQIQKLFDETHKNGVETVKSDISTTKDAQRVWNSLERANPEAITHKTYADGRKQWSADLTKLYPSAKMKPSTGNPMDKYR